MQYLKQNWLFLVLLAIAVAIFSLGVTPWLWENGHRGLALAGYAICAMVLVYCRANKLRARKPRKQKAVTDQ